MSSPTSLPSAAAAEPREHSTNPSSAATAAGSSSPLPPANDVSSSADATLTVRKTRLLKDVEAEENKYIYETLYKSLDDVTDTAIRDDLTVGDTVRQAREAKKEFLQATSLPIKEKMKGCAALMRSFAEEKNKRVAYVFMVYSVLILTLPLIMLLLGTHVVAPWMQVDATFCGGGMAVGTALVLVTSYVVYAVREDIAEMELTAAAEAEERKKK